MLLSEEIKELFRSIHDLNLHVKTVYVGGGTPTILSAEQMRFLFSAINECTDVSQLEEFTYESGRPDTITKEKLQVAREYGVTRICVNPQTLCNEILGQVERHHTAEDFLRAFTLAKESGIPSINTDLIAGLPGDNFITFSNSMDRILELKPSNITVHTFCIKRSAEIKNKRKDIYTNHGEDTGKCVDYSQIRAVHDGYHPYYMYRQKNTVGNYENVGFAQPGCEGLYNVYMMEEVHSIFSAGAGAVTKLVDYRMDSNGKVFIERLFNPKYPYEYLRKELTGERYKKIEEFYLSRGLL